MSHDIKYVMFFIHFFLLRISCDDGDVIFSSGFCAIEMSSVIKVSQGDEVII